MINSVIFIKQQIFVSIITLSNQTFAKIKYIFRKISLRFCIFLFINFREKIQNFAKKFAKYKRKFSQFFCEAFRLLKTLLISEQKIFKFQLQQKEDKYLDICLKSYLYDLKIIICDCIFFLQVRSNLKSKQDF